MGTDRPLPASTVIRRLPAGRQAPTTPALGSDGGREACPEPVEGESGAGRTAGLSPRVGTPLPAHPEALEGRAEPPRPIAHIGAPLAAPPSLPQPHRADDGVRVRGDVGH